MALSLTELLGLAGTIIFAIPVAMLGLDFLLDGRPLGLAFLAIAATMVLAEKYLFRPSDIPEAVANRVVGRFVKSPEDEEQ